MNTLASALGKKFVEHKEAVRTRQFTLGGHTFKVKVPLTAEYEAMQINMKNLDESKVIEYYQELTKELEQFRENPNNELKVEFKEKDIVVDGRSMMEAARNKLGTEVRITEMFKLLVPEEQGFDMNTITYQMIEELFPFPIQMQVIEEIGKTVSPSYGETKGK